MNKTYRLIWNETTHTWAVVSELAKARGKRASGAVILAAAGILLAPSLPAFAVPPNPPAATQLPTSGQVVAGQASIAQSGATMNINQSTNSAAINWQTFNIGSTATVNFIQPSASSTTLNRVSDPNPSQIFGRINANGQVFLSNASGVYFGRGSSVNVGALTATTHSISDTDFMAGRYNFTRNGATGAVTNDGDLTANLGGYIALLAPEVRNTGVIVAQMGTVALAAGEAFELQFDGNNTLANIRVTPATLAALVENGNAVQAPGGLVILSARAADQLQGSVVRNSGVIEAKGLVEKGGKIVLEGDHITLASGSTLDASGATGGGEVLVGGGWQGSGRVYQATTVTMEQGAIIDVSAIKVGAGGTAVLWSNVRNASSVTTVQGSIFAKGGENGGDGGRIETSGHVVDTVGAFVSAAAPAGRGGLWLIDPPDATINQVVADGYVTTLNTGTSVLNEVAGDITLDTGVNIAKSAGGDATLTFKATGSVMLNSGATISSTLGKLNTVLWSDSDGNSDGYIWLDGAQITTNAGHLWMGGGSGSATWNSLTVGDGYAWGNASRSIGISLYGTNTLSTGGGNVAMYGAVGAIAANTNGVTQGIRFHNTGASSINSGAGRITINAKASGIGADNSAAIDISGAGHSITSAATSGDAITIIGNSSAATATGFSGAVWLGSPLTASGGGNIKVSGNRSTSGGGATNMPAIGIERLLSAGAGNLTLIGDEILFWGGSASVSGTAALTVKPYTAGTTIGIAGGAGTLALTAANFSTNFVNGFSGITIGDATSGDITVGGATTLNDFTTFITGGNLALNASGQTVTLTGGSGGTVSGSGVITATSLLLNGSGATYTLNSGAGHSVGTLAASTGSGNVSFYNNAALAVGTVSGTNGITTTGTVDVETLTGDLTVSQNITTTSTSASAVVLNAGRSTAALTTTGGNILISGSPTVTVGAGGTAKFYSGSVSGSTGLTALIGSDTGRFRYASDETTTNYTTALSSGKNAIYRESFALTVAPDAYTSTYGAAVAPTAFTVSSGTLQNGDSLTGTITATITSTGTSTSNAGTYDLSISGLPARNSLGYALTGAGNTGGHTISALPVTPPPVVIPPVVTPPPLPSPTTNPPPLVPPASAPLVPLTAPPGIPSNLGGISSSGGESGAVTAGNVGSGGVSVAMVREASVQSSGIITVSVPKEMAAAGSGFSFPLPAQVNSAATGNNATISVTTASGGALPAWLKFNPETKTFVASAVPDGAFPMQVIVTVNGQSTTVVISERPGE